jgi:hypothetical protein
MASIAAAYLVLAQGEFRDCFPVCRGGEATMKILSDFVI